MTEVNGMLTLLRNSEGIFGSPSVRYRLDMAADEIERLRAALSEVVAATDVGAYLTARRAAEIAIGRWSDD